MAMEQTSHESVPATDGDEGDSNADSSADSSADTPAGAGSTLWEQMMAREGRDAACPSGVRAGDWQAERQLQEVLRESLQEVRASDASGGGEDTEQSFIDAAFRALGTNTVEEEQFSGERRSNAIQSSDSRGGGGVGGGGGGGVGASASDAAVRAVETVGVNTATDLAQRKPAQAGGDSGETGEEQNELDVEEDEDFGNVELVVTKDGGIVPVTSDVGEETGDLAVAAAAAAEGGKRGGHWKTREGAAEHGPASKAINGKAAAAGTAGGVAVNAEKKVASTSGSKQRVRNARKGGVDGGAAGVEERKEEGTNGEGGGEDEEGKEETPLPPDALLTLSDDVLHKTMLFLHPEDIFECRAVSVRWEFPLHEAVFEGLCRRTYLAQSAKKLLNVNRWRSWQRMYKFRPRLRDTGLYSLKTTYFKKPVRDMSTTWVPGTVLKVTYYRYFRFFGDGRVAYGLTHDPPKEFVRMLQEGSPKVVYGTYSISKWEVAVEIPTPWSTVNFGLQLANGERGRFTHLVVSSHSSVPRNDPRAGRCHHRVKSSDVFMFRRMRQF